MQILVIFGSLLVNPFTKFQHTDELLLSKEGKSCFNSLFILECLPIKACR